MHFFRDTYDVFMVVIIMVITVLVFTSLLFFIMTLHKRYRNIKKLALKKKFQERIDAVLFELLFGKKSVEEVVKSSKFRKCLKYELFQRVSIKAIVALHQSYTGVYSVKLEQFFAASGLAKYSLKQLHSKRWPNKVEGIRDLSNMNFKEAYSRIASYKKHKNYFVKTEVVLGLLRMNGISELFPYKDSDIYINDWVQSNILYILKTETIPVHPDIPILLESRNPSVVLLGVRLIYYYKMAEHYQTLADYRKFTNDSKLKTEIELLLKKTMIPI